AIDRNHLVDLAGGPDVAAVSCQVLPPGMNGYRRYCPYTIHPRLDGRYHGPDPAKARRLVNASGTKGQSVTVWFWDIPIGHRNGDYLVRVLRSLGYRAKLKTVALGTSTYDPRRQAGVDGWGADFPSANNFFTPLLTCGATLA